MSRSRTSWTASVFALLASVALMASGCGQSGGLTVGGSTTVQPLSEAWSDVFMEEYPGIEIAVQGGGSSAGIKGAAVGTLDIGAASRELRPSELESDLTVYRVAADGIAVVVHPDSAIDGMTIEELREIYMQGSNEEWTVVNREEGSGTREVFWEKAMNLERMSPMAEFLPSNGAVKEKVASTENGIGYISLGYVDDSVKPLLIEGVECTPQNCLDGTYMLMRYLLYVTRGDATGDAKTYIDFCLGPVGQRIVGEEGYIPVG